MKRVLAAGTFDGIHPGHLKFLQYARKFGQELGVVVARDQSVRKIKGRTPLFNEKERLAMVLALKPVDFAFIGSSDWLQSVKKANPETIVLGHDQKKDGKEILRFAEKNKLKLKKVVRAPAFDRKRLSGTLMKRKTKVGKTI